MALKSAIGMAALSGATADIPGYQAQLSSIARHYNQAFWKNAAAYGTDDRANAMAVVAGFADSTNWPGVRNVLTTVDNAGPWMEKFTLEALYKMGDAKGAMDRMKRRYAGMVNNPSTTLWENFDCSGTMNHGWGGGPLIMLSQYAAGVAPMATAYDTFQVQPQPGYLDSLSAVVPTIKGDIRVSIKKADDQFRLKFNAPLKTVAIAGLSKDTQNPFTQITCNGQTVWENGVVTDNANVHFVGEDRLHIKFRVGPGDWNFVGQYSHTVGSEVALPNQAIDFLAQNHPNPFNGMTQIRFGVGTGKGGVSDRHRVSIKLYSLDGRLQTTLVQDRRTPGSYHTTLDNRKMHSGVYFCKLDIDGRFQRTIKLLCVK
jgi:hypothetical protein